MCYLLSSCGQMVAQRCGQEGCWSGSRYGEVRLSPDKADRAAEKIIYDVMEDRRQEEL